MVIPLERLLSQKYLTTAAPVLVLGFPMGLRSEQYARPITRHGIVARSDNGELLLDVFVFPGNSGGPVFYSPVLKTDSSISSPLVNEERLVGLVVDYVPYVDIAVSPQTRRPRVTFEENSGLCHAVPADRILELVSRADFLKFDQQLK
jgi:hypothetical protein